MGYNPFARDYRDKEERDKDDARAFAELVLDEVIDRYARSGDCFRLGADLLADEFIDHLAGTDLEGKIRQRYRDLYEDQKAHSQAAE